MNEAVSQNVDQVVELLVDFQELQHLQGCSEQKGDVKNTDQSDSPDFSLLGGIPCDSACLESGLDIAWQVVAVITEFEADVNVVGEAKGESVEMEGFLEIVSAEASELKESVERDEQHGEEANDLTTFDLVLFFKDEDLQHKRQQVSSRVVGEQQSLDVFVFLVEILNQVSCGVLELNIVAVNCTDSVEIVSQHQFVQLRRADFRSSRQARQLLSQHLSSKVNVGMSDWNLS